MKRNTFLLCLTIAAVNLLTAVSQAQVRVKCGECGSLIKGAYFETGGTFYHPECFTCEYCGDPIKESYTAYREKNYHTLCFESNIALRCTVCDGVIEGEYLLDYWGNSYHSWHKGKVLSCDFCQRFIAGSFIEGMMKYSDGRFLCGICAPSAVTDVETAEHLMFEVAEQLGKFGLEIDPRRVRLHLVGRDKLRKLSPRPSYNTTGFVDYLVEKNLFGQIKSQSIKVYLLYGMPRVQAIGAIAHELTHVWQFVHGYLKLDSAMSEGSGNYASYLVLKKISDRESEFIIENMLKDEDPIYGAGFRRVKKYAERKGLAAWLQLMKKKNASLSSPAP